MSSQNSEHISNGNPENIPDKRDPAEQKPKISQTFLKDVVLRLYGMEVVDWKELNSYDDRNYHIKIHPTINNKYIDKCNPLGYVLKVLNSADSKTPIVIGKIISVYVI